MINIIEGGITAAKGFSAASTAAGIKKNGKNDMALIFSSVPCIAAGTFTTNCVKAAPVLWDKNLLENGNAFQAIVVNSGVANAATGQEGMSCCEETATEVASRLLISRDSVFVASTGVIGMPLPMNKIKTGIEIMVDELDSSIDAGTKAAGAMMTTDTQIKEKAFTFTVSDGTVVTIGGCAKGSGMIHPNMCTMLSFITTDINISPELLKKALSDDVKDTFNMISVDGDTSTNDTVLVLANGLSGNKTIEEEDEDYQMFREVLHELNLYLAKQIAADGEGATALFSCHVVHASSKDDARLLARSVVSSVLTKAAIAGHDANWGRILCAMGYSGAEFDPLQVDLSIESMQGKMDIVKAGTALDFDEEEATAILSESEIIITADMNAGASEATAFGCDITHEYISINADYRS